MTAILWRWVFQTSSFFIKIIRVDQAFDKGPETEQHTDIYKYFGHVCFDKGLETKHHAYIYN